MAPASVPSVRRFKRLGCAVAGLLLLSSAADATEIRANTAVLRWIDKVVARVSTVEAPVGESVHVGTLELIVRACSARPPEETPENAAFLDVWEVKPGEPAAEVFRGWMFSSSPALSAMEHPVYDLWLVECRNVPDADSPPPHLKPAR
ncbi:MAG: DUF2155 domain-containing protein [Alphaproteobacteria bacterium]|nr:DUF2155 domain-containing protein [Alphaproteobacteria bacterium]